ncbi:tetratricopeptide repeat protein [Thermodesulfobacteriota bacterium]
MKLNIWKFKYLRIIFVAVLFFAGISCTSKEERKAEHKERARQYIEKNELKKAVIELKNVVQLDPKDDAAYYDLGETYMKLEQLKEAAWSFAQAVNSNPENMKAKLKMGQIFLMAKQTKDARIMAKAVLEKIPDSIEALLLLSGVQIQERNLGASIKTLEKAASIDPEHFKTHLFLAHLFLVKGNHDKAEKAYLRAISLDSSSRVPYMELTRLYGTKGEWDKAESLLKQMVQAPQGQKQQKLLILARFYEKQKRWVQAEKTYLEAADSAPGEDVVPLMNLGSYYARRKTYDKALKAMQKASGIKKNDMNILASIAQLHFDFKKIKDAETTVDEVLVKNGEHVRANFLKGRLYLLKGDFANALKRFDLVLRESPKNAMAHYYKALCLIGEGGRDLDGQDLHRTAAGFEDDPEAWQRKLAEQELLKAVELNPRLLNARLILAEIYLREKNKQLAREQIEIALKLAPRHLKALTFQGILKIIEGDVKGAEAVCKKVLELNPNYPLGYVRMGLVYNLMKRPADALKSFQKALELNPFQNDALGLMVDIYVRDKKFDKALKLCEKQKQKTAEDRTNVAFIEYLEGKVFMARRDTKKAQQHFKKAIELDPNTPAPYMALAGIYMQEKKIPRAILQYETVLNKNRNYLPACMALGTIYDRQGDKKRAESYYRKALEIKKDFGPAANNLAFILAAEGVELDEALKLALLARNKMPKDANVMDTLGWIHYLKGGYLSAISELEESISRNPDSALANYHLGLAYYENEDYEKAREFLERALKIDTNFKGADKARSMLDR